MQVWIVKGNDEWNNERKGSIEEWKNTKEDEWLNGWRDEKKNERTNRTKGWIKNERMNKRREGWTRKGKH